VHKQDSIVLYTNLFSTIESKISSYFI